MDDFITSVNDVVYTSVFLVTRNMYVIQSFHSRIIVVHVKLLELRSWNWLNTCFSNICNCINIHIVNNVVNFANSERGWLNLWHLTPTHLKKIVILPIKEALVYISCNISPDSGASFSKQLTDAWNLPSTDCAANLCIFHGVISTRSSNLTLRR